MERVREREPLERVVRRPGDVEVAPEPAGAEMRVGGAHLPVVARGEVRLVGVGVADRREHGQLALAVELGQRREGRVPAQARVLREGLAGVRGERELRAEARVLRVSGREEHRERVGPALEEDGDEDRAGGRALGAGDPFVEEPERELAGAVHGEGEPGGARQEGAAVEPAAGGGGHARLDHRKATTGLGDAAPEGGRAGELVAGAAHGPQQVW